MAVQVSRESCVELRVNPGFVLRSDAAAAWDRAVTAFGKRVLITGAWRSYETQVRLFTERYVKGYYAGSAGFTDDVRRWNGLPTGTTSRSPQWTRRMGTASAAVPGTSNHGGGVAVDVKTRREDDDPPYSQAVIFSGWSDTDRTRFLAVAAEHGWDDDEGREVDEHWHLTYYPTRDRHWGQLVSNPIGSGGTVTVPTLPGAPAPITPEEDMQQDERDALMRVKQILEAFDPQRQQLVEGAARVLGVIRSRTDAEGNRWHVLDEGDGAEIVRRSVAETSAAYHQLAALLADDGEALATAIIAGLTPVIGEVQEDVIRDAVSGAIAGLTPVSTVTTTLIPAADQT